ncbi:GerW family sporulation protein [Symbiobacterium thermophilum]|uniref:Sporulation protein n=1 Tax=Symbiobacterium thermophilum TaxID=2734 RepID=A0A953LIB1_SYMTR|nr:spore germination protein GerW family protein [Symbiobacterium thermophilum]MBY6275869.1 sporulation protein [Symbiobacterium thermophilum]
MAAEMLNSVMATLEKHLHIKSIVGEPMTVGDVTLIPVMDLTFGFGAGGGEGRDEKQGGSGVGGGGGARLAAKAVIVIKDGEVSVLPLGRGTAIDKIVEKIPGILEKVNVNVNAGGKEKDDDE